MADRIPGCIPPPSFTTRSLVTAKTGMAGELAAVFGSERLLATAPGKEQWKDFSNKVFSEINTIAEIALLWSANPRAEQKPWTAKHTGRGQIPVFQKTSTPRRKDVRQVDTRPVAHSGTHNQRI